MTADIDLLPLPEWMSRYTIPTDGFEYGEGVMLDDCMRDYASANVARNTALLRAEIEALRAEVEEWRSFAEVQVEMRDEAEDHAEALGKALAELITWIPSADTYRRLGFDPEAPMRALKRAKLSIGSVGGLRHD